MTSHDALRRSLKYKLKLILSENKILIQTIEDHVKKAEAVYRDTESLDKISTSVFKQAMGRLETAYSACIKLILLASDLFESEPSGSPEKTEVSHSNSNKVADTDGTNETMQPVDNETLRRLNSLERKFQAYVAMRGQEANRGLLPEMPAVGDWFPTVGQSYKRTCRDGGVDVCFPPDPVTELNRFLFGLEYQSYDGYRDPRIILSNERKKFPNEKMAEVKGDPTTPRPLSPVRETVARSGSDTVGGVGYDVVDMGPKAAEIKHVCYKDNHQRFGADGSGVRSSGCVYNNTSPHPRNHDGIYGTSSPRLEGRVNAEHHPRFSGISFLPSPCTDNNKVEPGFDNAVVLNSPDDLETKWPRIGQRSWRRDDKTCRSLVEAASEKLTQALNEIDNLPLHWLKRGRDIPSPPSPPPPTSEVCRSGRGKNDRQVGLEKTAGNVAEGLYSPGFETVRNDNPQIGFQHNFPDGSPHCEPDDAVFHCRELGQNYTDLVTSNPILKHGNDVNSAFSPFQRHKMPDEPEEDGNTFSPRRWGCSWLREASPGKTTEFPTDQKPRSSCLKGQCMSPQRFIAPFECASPSFIHRPKPCHMLPTELATSEKEGQLNHDDVYHILDRIGNLERLLEHEIAAEKGLLTQCLFEIQHLLGSSFAGTTQCYDPGRKSLDEIKTRSKQDKSIIKNAKHKDTKLSSEERVTSVSDTEGIPEKLFDLLYKGKRGGISNKRTRDCVKQQKDSALNSKRCQQEVKSLEADKARQQPSKNYVQNKVSQKEIRACFEEALATLGFERRKATEGVEDRELDNFEYDPLSRDVTTTSCSSTNAWEDSGNPGSSQHVGQQEKLPRQEKVNRARSKGHKKHKNCSSQNCSDVQDESALSMADGNRHPHQNSPKSSQRCKSQSENCQLSPAKDERFKTGSEKSQKAMLQQMIKMLNKYLLKISALSKNLDSSNTTSSRACQDVAQKRGSKICASSCPPQIPTEPTATPKLSYDATVSCGDNLVGKTEEQKQRDSTTQTCDLSKPYIIPDIEPLLIDASTPKVSVQHINMERSSFIPGTLVFPASPKPSPLNSRTLHGYPSSPTQGRNSANLPQTIPNQPAEQPDGYSQHVPDIKNTSYKKYITTLDNYSNGAATPIPDVNHQQPSFGLNNIFRQIDGGYPRTFPELPDHISRQRVETDIATSKQQMPLESLVQYMNTGDRMDKNTAPEGLGHPMPFFSKVVDEGHGDCTIVTSQELNPLGLAYESQYLSGVVDYGDYQHQGDSNELKQPVKQKDQYFQISSLPEKDQYLYHHYQQQHHQQQQQQPPQFSSYQSPTVSCPEHLLYSHNDLPLYPQLPPNLQPTHQANDPQQHPINQTAFQQQASMPTMCRQRMTQPSPNFALPNSCPTVAFASVSCEPMPPDQRVILNRTTSPTGTPLSLPLWTSNSQCNPAHPLLPNVDPNPGQDSRGRPSVRHLSQQFDQGVLSPGDHIKPPSASLENVKAKHAKTSAAAAQKPGSTRRTASQGASAARSKAEDRTICLTNLPPQLAEMDLLQTLNEHGFVSKIYFIKHRSTGQFQGTAYVKFRECAEAESAVNALNGLEVQGQKITATLMSKKSSKSSS